MAHSLSPRASQFRGYPFEAFTSVSSFVFYKNNCPSGQSGGAYTYTKTYTSYISQEDAEAKRIADGLNYIGEGQQLANSNGTCTIDPAPDVISVNGYIKPGYTAAVGGWLYVTDRSRHCVVVYDNNLGGRVRSPLQDKNGEAIIGVRGTSGTSKYHLRNPSDLSACETAVVIVNNNFKEIKVFDLNSRTSNKVAEGRVIIDGTGFTEIYSVAIGELNNSGIPLIIYFVAKTINNKLGVYKVNYNNSNPSTGYTLSFYLDYFYYSNEIGSPPKIEYSYITLNSSVVKIPIITVASSIIYSDIPAIYLNTTAYTLSGDKYKSLPWPNPRQYYLSTYGFTVPNDKFGVPSGALIGINQFYTGSPNGTTALIRSDKSNSQRVINNGSLNYFTYDKINDVLYFFDLGYKKTVSLSTYNGSLYDINTGIDI